MDVKTQYKCDVSGAWLMLSLQDDEIALRKTVVVMTLWFHYANVVVGPERRRRTIRRSCALVFQ
jgi:hypothetical protein